MKRRRFRSPHPGVKIRKRRWKTADTYTAVYIEPDDLREKSVSLTALGLTSAESRKAWAVQKSRELQRRKEELSLGAPKRTETEIGVAIDRYLADKALETRPRTVEIYKECIARFRRWAEAAKLRIAEQLSPPQLSGLRSHLIALPKRNAAKGGKRGERNDAAERRSPVSVNRDLRSIKTMLNEWRRRGLTPLLNSDHIADALRFVRVPRHLKQILDQDALAVLFQACLKHDAVVFKETRAEHMGLVPKGTTPRYFEITPFVLTVLLTGCRLGEVTRLEWRQVYLEHGYIALDDAMGVKTGMGRRITLDETPLLAKLLGVLKIRAGSSAYVFGDDAPISHEVVQNCRARLLRAHGAPPFNWQMLRRTCGTFLTCADGLYKGSSAWMSAARLGHSVEVAQRHYIGALRNIPKDVKSLEEAMGLEKTIKAYFRDRLGINLDLPDELREGAKASG